MKPAILLALPLMLLAGCVEEPVPKDAKKAAEAIEQDQVKKRQLSIEHAAEEATKLIEADAKAETNDMVAEKSVK